MTSNRKQFTVTRESYDVVCQMGLLGSRGMYSTRLYISTTRLVTCYEHAVICSLHFKGNDIQRSGFSCPLLLITFKAWYCSISVPAGWEQKPYLTSKPPDEREFNKFLFFFFFFVFLFREKFIECSKKFTYNEQRLQIAS